METRLVALSIVGLTATYTWVDQIRQGQADKKLKEAGKVACRSSDGFL
jgi:hypothetical protein